MTIMIYGLVNLSAFLPVFGDQTFAPNFRVNVIFRDVGFRPGWRGPFVLAKGPKTIDAPVGLIKAEGRKL